MEIDLIKPEKYDLGLNTRISDFCNVFSAPFYGMDTWTLNENVMNKFEALVTLLYRRILRLFLVARVTNEEGITTIVKVKEVLNTVKIKKQQYSVSDARGEKYHTLRLIVEGKLLGMRTSSRARLGWKTLLSCTTVDLFFTMTANILNGDCT